MGNSFGTPASRVTTLDDGQLSIGVTSRYFDNETGEEKLAPAWGKFIIFAIAKFG